MPAFMAEGGMPYWIDLMTSDVRKSSHFYGELLAGTLRNCMWGTAWRACRGFR